MALTLRGAFTALITPMKENGDVDHEGFRELMEFQIREGIDGIVPLGTTGETPTLDEDEEERLIRIAVETVKGRVPLIIGTGSNDTRHMISYTKRARDLGADAALVVTPYYNKPNDSGLLRHFEAAAGLGIPVIVYNIASRTGRNIPTALLERIARFPGIIGVKEASGDINQMGEVIERIARRQAQGEGHFEAAAGVGIPVIVYNVASRTGRNIPTALLERIARLPGIIGVKEASGDINQMGEVIERIVRGQAPGEAAGGGRPFAVLSGDDAFTLPLMALGGDGVISVISNLVPAQVKALTRAGLAGDFAEARRIHYQLLPLVKAAFIETNPVPIKAAMNLAGLPAGPARLPLGDLEPRNEGALRAALEGLGIRVKG